MEGLPDGAPKSLSILKGACPYGRKVNGHKWDTLLSVRNSQLFSHWFCEVGKMSIYG